RVPGPGFCWGWVTRLPPAKPWPGPPPFFVRSLPMGASKFSRRGFLLGAGAGLVAGVPLTLWAQKPLREIGAHVFTPFRGVTHEDSRPAYAMPGPFPGRVVEVRHRDAVRA